MFVEINKEALKRLPFALHTIGESNPQGNISRPNGFAFHHLLWITEGSGIFEIDGEILTLSEGEGIFTKSGIAHGYSGKFSTMWLTFAMEEKALEYMVPKPWFSFTIPENMTVEARQLMAFSEGKSNIFSRSAQSYVFVTDFFMKVLSTSISLSDKALDILERKYSEPLSLSDIAQELHTDKYTLCRIYKSEKGVTLMDDLLRIRIQKAKSFLKISGEKVSDIGMMCGFENSCYFIKRFREKVGCTPSQYRNRN